MKATKTAKAARMAAFFAAACMAGMPVAGAEEGAAENLAQLFYTYSQDNMVFDYYEEDEIYAYGELEQNSYSGFLSIWQLDLNLDGSQELLAVRIKNKDGKNDVLAEIYEQQENRLQRITQYVLAENVLTGETARIDVFLTDTSLGKTICCETSESSSLTGNGMAWGFRAAAFDGTVLYDYQDPVWFSNSFIDEPEIEQASAALAGVGLYPADVVFSAATDQVGNLEKMNTISRYYTGTYEEVYQFLEDGGYDWMQYGETHFYSYVNQGYDNKITSEFAVAAAQANASDGTFILPDSDARLIDQSELDGLSEHEIFLARNEIYARHGRIFNNEELQAYFEAQPWYQPSVPGSEFTEEYAANVFNQFEIQNIAVIVSYERAHGLNGNEITG